MVKNESATISIFNDPKANTSKVSVTSAVTEITPEESEKLDELTVELDKKDEDEQSEVSARELTGLSAKELDEAAIDELEKVSDEEFSSETSAKEL